jgi:hypothetical protein
MDILIKYNFPSEYISWIKLIYNDLRANVLINGHKSELIQIGRSVKQGDALSCALFIIAIDPLLRAIENNAEIDRITFLEKDGTHIDIAKVLAYADDITALCKNKEGVKKIIELYNKFSMFSGISLNVKKTEIMLLGKGIDNKREKFEIMNGNETYTIIDQDSVKVCGITFSRDESISYKENVINKIDKMEKKLTLWRMRNLTLQGKILIAKTFGLSQLIYSMRAITINKKEIKTIDNVIYKFIWNIKPSSTRSSGKIRREILQNSLCEGGLKAPDINSLDLALKYKHLIRCFTINHPINTVTRSIMNKKENDNI